MRIRLDGKEIKLIVGLGNPGKEYERTYHNVGVMALEHIRRALEGTPYETNKRTRFAWSRGEGLVFVKPLTYMNEAGTPVALANKLFKVPPRALLVIHDESDLALGTYRISFDRGAAGHRGVQSVIDALGTKAFFRIRIGIRPERERGRAQAGEFVLKTISNRDQGLLEEVLSDVTTKSILKENV